MSKSSKNSNSLVFIILIISATLLIPSSLGSTTTSTSLKIAPDLIIYNGTIITMDDDYPQVEAVAIHENKILTTGSSENIFALANESTVIINLKGNTLLPGFIDSHSHWIGDRNLVDQGTAKEAIQSVIENGWTSISELFVNQDRLDELRSLDLDNDLRIRVNVYLPISWQFERFGDWYQEYEPGHEYSSKLRIGGIKIFMDRWIGNRTVLYFDQDELNNLVQEAHNLGYQIAIHSVSENGTDFVLNSYESVLGSGKKDLYRPRIEHLVSLRDDQIQRMKDLDIIASLQLTWFNSDWENDTVDDIGIENVSFISRWSDIVDAGIKSIGSTDFPWSVGPIGSVIQTMYNAITRIGLLGLSPPEWMVNQILTIEQVLRMITIDAAYATFQEDVKGSISEGKFADFVLLSENPLNTPKLNLLDLNILMTMIGGNVEFCETGFKSLCDGKVIEPTTADFPNNIFIFSTILLVIFRFYKKKKHTD